MLQVLIGVTFRTGVAFVAMFKAGLSKKEQLFVALSWLPQPHTRDAQIPVHFQCSVHA